jgi:glycosyltransferase involved in cell wall biosynthesis
MRIVIDLQGAQTESRFRGIGRYAQSFAQALARHRGEHRILLALNDLFPETIEPIRAAFDGLIPQYDIHVWSAPGPLREIAIGNESRRRVAELVREAYLMSLSPDIVHVTSLFEGYADDAATSIGRLDEATPVSVTLFDLIPLANPEIYLERDAGYERYYRCKLAHLRRASLLLSISNWAGDEARKYLEGLQCDIVAVSTAAAAEFRGMDVPDAQIRQFERQFGVRGDFILYTGGADERKNLSRLITAFAGLPQVRRSGLQLVIAGAMPESAVDALRAQAAAASLRREAVIFTGYVSDEALIALYNRCKAFVFPSWHEGFGLPALEAMQCGAAVIGANASSLPEVVGRSDALFDPFDVESIRAKLAQVVEDDHFRAELATYGPKRAREFSWDKVAQRAISAFENLHRARAGPQRRPAPDHVARLAIDAVVAECSSQPSEAEVVAIARAIARIRAVGGKPRLFVDVSELAQRDARTGIQRVTRSILAELLEAPPEAFDLHPVYATVDGHGYCYADRFVAGLRGSARGVAQDRPIDHAPGDVFVGLDLQHHVVIAQRDYLEKLRRQGVLVTFVVYDLLPITLAATFPPGADVGHKLWLDVIARFDGVLCISNAVADELVTWLRDNPIPRLRPLQIRSFPLGADLAQRSMDDEPEPGADLVLAALADDEAFLTVGTVEPRKGHDQILRAFESLWERGEHVKLVIVGKEGWMVSDLCERLRAHPERGQRLFWLEGISDDYLARLYRACSCLIAASTGEGFGLPLIEAAQHGMPIIARDIPVFREVAGDHAFFFRGSQPGDLAASILEWRRREAAGCHPRPAGMKWLSWKQSAAALTAVVLEIREGRCSTSESN